MTYSESLRALRRTNPRRWPGNDAMLDQLATNALGRVDLDDVQTAMPVERRWSGRAPRRMTRPAFAIPAAAASLVAATIVVATVLVGSPVGPPAVAPAAAMESAAARTAAAADQSGIVRVQISRNGDQWAAETVHWNANNVALSDQQPTRSGGDLLLVDGIMYAQDDPNAPGEWVEIGSPDLLLPGSGTGPNEFLTAAREDAGGETLRRLTAAMADLTTTPGADGSTVYGGHVPAGDLARERGFKEGTPIRVLPYGYVAHDAANDPSAPIAVTITVGADSTIRSITATWGGGSTWVYELTFRELGSAPELTAPSNPRMR